MKHLTTLGLAAGLFTAWTGMASALSLSVVAADCDPNVNGAVANYTPFTLDCGTTTDRQDSGNVNLGAPDGEFYSLGLDANGGGFGGLLILEIDPAFTGTAMIFEVTNPSNHLEAANVFVSNTLDAVAGFFVGSVDNGNGGSVAPSTTVNIAGGPWTYLWLQDTSREVYGASGSEDGFDIDSITLTAVPLPAGVLLLGTALAGLGVARRRG